MKSSDRDQRSMIEPAARGLFILVHAYHNHHKAGFADWKGVFGFGDTGQLDAIAATVSDFDDHELRTGMLTLKTRVDEMKRLDLEITDWLAEYVNLPPARDKSGVSKLERRLKKIISSGADGGPQGPVWLLDPEYQALVARSARILDSASMALAETIERAELLGGSG